MSTKTAPDTPRVTPSVHLNIDRIGDSLVDTETGEVIEDYAADVCDLQAWRLRYKVTTLLTDQLRVRRKSRSPEPEDDHDQATIDHLPAAKICTALRYQGLVHKMMAAYPHSWYDRLCNFVDYGCIASEIPHRRQVLQDVLVKCVTDGQIFSPIWEIGNAARSSTKLRQHLVEELLQSYRNRERLADVVALLLECVIRADGREFSRSVRQIADDSDGTISASHVGRYLAEIADYGGSVDVPIFTARKGRQGGTRATRFTLNPSYAYLLDLV